MKKTIDSNNGIKKQLMSGAVYVALAVTVVAVTVSTITATFSDKEAEQNHITDNNTKYNSGYQLKLPDTNIPDAPVSDVEQGVEAKVTEPEKKDSEDANKDSADTPKNDASDGENKQANAAEKLPEPDAENNEHGEKDSEEIESKKKPTSEEPAEETFETGYNGYIKPCSGYISKEFSVDMPVYSATMYDYRTHGGVDIACDIGTPVKAVTNGYIVDVYDDYMFGKTVVIEHAGGVYSVYSNLSPDLPAETVVGRRILTGEIIGGVGESALCESSEVSHLHFEMLKDGSFVDPEEYI